MNRIALKVCCISNVKEAELALEKGADFLGLVGPMPSGPGILSLAEIRVIVQSIPTSAKTILLTSEEDPLSIIKSVSQLAVSAVQIVREIPIAALKQIRVALPDVLIFSVVHVVDEQSIDTAMGYEGLADYILLDSGKPAKGILGGTGEVHNWNLSRAIVEHLKTPVFLAGGLNPGNVADAISLVKPYGVDLCSGLRTNDELDPMKLNTFIENLP